MSDATAPLELPIGVTESKVLKQLARIESQLRKTQNQATDNFIRKNKKVIDSFSSVRRSAVGMSNGTKFAIQNVGYQVQDFIVQVQGGTSATRAMSQQLPQLLSGFGLLGIGLGTVVPLVVGFASALSGTDDEAERAEKSLKSIASAINELESATRNASVGYADLLSQYGAEGVDQAREFLNVQREIAKIRLTRELATASSLVGSIQTGGFEASAEQWREVGRLADEYFAKIENAQNMDDLYGARKLKEELADAMLGMDVPLRALRDLSEMFGVNYTEAGKLGAAFMALKEADGPKAQSEAAAALRDRLEEVSENTDGVSDEVLDLREHLLTVEEAGLRVAAIDIGANIRSATSDAQELAKVLSEIAALGNAAQADKSYLDNYNMVLAYQAYGQSRMSAPDEPVKHTVQKTRSGGGGSRRSSSEDVFTSIAGDTAELERQLQIYQSWIGSFDDLQREIAITAKEQDLLNRAQREGREITPALAAELRAAAEGYVDVSDAVRQAKDRHDALNDVVGDFKESVIDAALGGADAMDSFTESLKRALAQYLLFGDGFLSDILGGGGSSSGGLIGSVFGGLFGGARAGGGPVSAGVPYLVNENTPRSEVFVPSQNGAILNVPQAQKALAASRSAPQVIYVPQPYVADLSASDDGQMMASFVRVSDARTSAAMSANNRAIIEARRRG